MANLEQVKMAFDGMRKGTMGRVKYGSQVAVSAAARNMGWSIWKITEKTVQFGANYFNAKEVKDARAERAAAIEAGEADPWRDIPANMHFVEGYENQILKSDNKEQYYIQFLNVHNTNRYNIVFQVNYPDGSLVEMDKEELKAVIDDEENLCAGRGGKMSRIVTDGTYKTLFGTTVTDDETGETTTVFGQGTKIQRVKIEGVMSINNKEFIEDAEDLAESYRHARAMRIIAESRKASKKIAMMEARRARHARMVNESKEKEANETIAVRRIRPRHLAESQEVTEKVNTPIRRRRIRRISR